MSDATTGVPAAKPSVSTMPNDSPPSDGAASTSAACSAACFSASGDAAEDRHALALDEQRLDLGLRRADDGQPGGHVRAQRLEGAQQDRQALALDRLADEHDLERLARHPPARLGHATGRQRDAVGDDPVLAAVEAPAGPGRRLRDRDPRAEAIDLAARAEQRADRVRDPRLGVAVERADERRVGRRQRVPADDGRDRLVQVDDVELAGAQLAPQRGDGARRRRQVGDGAVGRPAERRAERDQPLRRLAVLRARSAVQPRRAAVVVIVGREHPHVMPGDQQLACERLDMPGHPAGIRPGVGRDDRDPHKEHPKRVD